MVWQNLRRIAKSKHIVLVPIMVLAFYMAFIPHHNYPYPVHIDEWVHMALSKAMLEAGSPTFTDPFLGLSTVSVSSNLEAGFHLLWGVFHQISGISWLSIFRYFPGIVLMMTVLATYVLADRQGFSWEAALFAGLIPTTVGILGPGFLVPVAMGLLFIPLSLFIVFNFRSLWAYLTVFIFTCFLLSIHAPSAICLAIILFPYILVNMAGDFRHSLGITLALAIPFLAPFPWIFDRLLPTASTLLTPQDISPYVQLPRVIFLYGYLPVLLCLLGVFFLGIRGNKRDYGLVLGLLALLAMLSGFFYFHYGVQILYQRGLMFMMLMLSIMAGAGLMCIKSLVLPKSLGRLTIAPFLRRNTGRALCLVLVALILFTAIPARQNTAYYYMIDDIDYEAFEWIKENVSEDYERAVLDPWKATAFVAVAGKQVYTRIHSYPKASDQAASAFLSGGCTDTDFLIENGVSIVYTRGQCDNPDLVEVRTNVYLLKDASDS